MTEKLGGQYVYKVVLVVPVMSSARVSNTFRIITPVDYIFIMLTIKYTQTN